MLAIRAGDDALAFTLLTDAIACADREHYEVEADLGRVQLAELIRTTQGKQEAWERLREAGIDAAAVGYWVASCRGAARSHRRTQITTRELGILRLMAEGLTARAAAERLGLSARTVSNHLQQVYQKLGAHSRTEAIHLARTAGLL
ncbi:MAG: LuxR C-terminal-related transcriptional regulator [Dehalococcoidia bacterium]